MTRCGPGVLLSVLFPYFLWGTSLPTGKLAPLPDPEGFAGMFAAATDEGLLAAGGHQFAGGIPWWHGGRKVWSSKVFLLPAPDGVWRLIGDLPHPVGDGVCGSFGGEMVCAGGGDATTAHREVFALRWDGRKLHCRELPSLPQPRLKMGGAVLGDTLYVVGGRNRPDSTTALGSVLALSLSNPGAQWRECPPLPGPPRMMPIVATTADALYVFGGIQIQPGPDGTAQNQAPYLADAYCFVPGPSGGWSRIADVPRSVAGAPSPALSTSGRIVIVGGVDGSIESVTDRSTVKSLPDDVLIFELDTQRWRTVAPLSAGPSRVNAPAARWHNSYVIVGGEPTPARRTNSCLAIDLAASSF